MERDQFSSFCSTFTVVAASSAILKRTFQGKSMDTYSMFRSHKGEKGRDCELILWKESLKFS